MRCFYYIIGFLIISWGCEFTCPQPEKEIIHVDTFNYKRINIYADSVLQLRKSEIRAFKKQAIKEVDDYREEALKEINSIKIEYQLYIDSLKDSKIYNNYIINNYNDVDTGLYNLLNEVR